MGPLWANSGACGEWGGMMRLDQAVVSQKSSRTPRPLRAADAGVPSAWAAVLVVGVTVLAYLAVTLADRAVHHGMDGPHVVAVTRWLIAGCIGVGTATWFFWAWAWERVYEVLWTTEETSAGQAAPQAAPGPRVLEVRVQQQNTWMIAASRELGIDDECLIRWADSMCEVEDLTEGRWAKDPAFPEGINQFKAFRAKLVARGLAGRSSAASNARFVLTAGGRAFVDRLARYSHALTYSQDGGMEELPAGGAGGGVARLEGGR